MSEKDGHLQAETHKGTDHLTVVHSGRLLRVTNHHDASQVPEEADVYTITGETVDFVSAVHGVKLVPVVHGLVINKRLGVAVWTESGSTFVPASDYPVATNVFLGCKN